ncbi:amidohydrolase family protein [Chloroflexota bacterium]
MAEKLRVVDVMNYLNYTKEGRDIYFSGPESSILVKRGALDYLPPPTTTEDFVKQMDQFGFEKVFLTALKMGSYRTHAMNMDFSNEMIYEEVKKFPDRLVGICGYDPYFIMDCLRDIERAVKEYGFKGVYAHTLGWGLRANDRRMYPVYAKCVELDIPFSMQTGQSFEPLPSEAGRPMYVDQVALDFPDLKFVCSHTGYPWVEEAVGVAWTRDNVYIDTSAHSPKSLLTRMKSLVDFMDSSLGRQKVLFGTNSFPFPMMLGQFMELPLKDESKAAILGENAIRLYKL